MRNPAFLPALFRALVGPLLLLACPTPAVLVSGAAETDYTQAIVSLESAIAEELRRGHISGVSVALVDDQRLLYAKGFGLADKSRRIPAMADTVYRAGSISKLFTALAAMQLAEQGRLNIDRPITNYAPDFRIVVPFEDTKPITLR
jgi:CubicO group peptidase (beta-lactamase class C family)